MVNVVLPTQSDFFPSFCDFFQRMTLVGGRLAYKEGRYGLPPTMVNSIITKTNNGLFQGFDIT